MALSASERNPRKNAAMQTDTDTKTVIEFLRLELQLQRRHYRILQEQHAALISRDRPRFAAAQMHYSGFLAEAKTHADNRFRLFGPANASLRQRMGQWSERDRGAGIAVIEAIRNTLERIQLIGRQNAAMIENELRYGKFMFDLYIEATRKQATYAVRGTQPVRSETLLINQVA